MLSFNDGSFFKSIRVFGGAEPPADSDRRLVVATAALQPYRATRKSFKPQLDSALLMQSSGLADGYGVAVENAFSVLGDLPEGPGGGAWSITRDAILTTAAEDVPVKGAVRRPWLAAETMDVVGRRGEARLEGGRGEWRGLEGVCRAGSGVDLELFCGRLADEAESGFRRGGLGPACRAVERLRGSARGGAGGSVARSDGGLCGTPAGVAERWRGHCRSTLGRSGVAPSAGLDSFAGSAAPGVVVSGGCACVAWGDRSGSAVGEWSGCGCGWHGCRASGGCREADQRGFA